jgi:cysteine desulfuration protein SufE|tara:strand:+ start:3139 stop:3549 length:411 start_codon:yes stop_codon:yes gene_type:complete
MIIEKIKAKGVEISVLEGTDRLQYLIDIANEVTELDNQYKIHDNKIAGCASNLWVVGSKQSNDTMLYRFDADAFITKGTAKLVIDLLNNEQIDEISKLSKDDFKNLGILELLTAQRQSGLSNLIDTLISIAKKNLA